MLNIMSLLAGLFGQALIIVLFIFLRPYFPENVLWLDGVMLSICFWASALAFGLRPVDLSDPSHKQVGGLGLKWVSVIWFDILVIAVIAVTLICAYNNEPLAFKWQLLIHCALIFLFILGLLSSSHATAKTDEIYRKERRVMQGKADLRFTLSDLAYIAESTPGIPTETSRRLRRLSDETRYITPSLDQMALSMESRIFATANQLRPALTDYEMNAPRALAMIDTLERDLAERKKY